MPHKSRTVLICIKSKINVIFRKILRFNYFFFVTKMLKRTFTFETLCSQQRNKSRYDAVAVHINSLSDILSKPFFFTLVFLMRNANFFSLSLCNKNSIIAMFSELAQWCNPLTGWYIISQIPYWLDGFTIFSLWHVSWNSYFLLSTWILSWPVWIIRAFFLPFQQAKK